MTMKAISESVVDQIAQKLRDAEVDRMSEGEFDGNAYVERLSGLESSALARDLIAEVCTAVLDGAPRLEVHSTGKHCPQDRRQFERLDLGVYGLVYLGEAEG